MGTAIAGGVFSYVAAAIVLLPILVKRSARRTICTISRNPAKWFVISGLFTGVSQMIRYMALALAPVTIVSSIMVSSLVFRFLFSRIINRDYEIFGIWVVFGIAITIVGSLALTLETAFVFSLLGLAFFGASDLNRRSQPPGAYVLHRRWKQTGRKKQASA